MIPDIVVFLVVWCGGFFLHEVMHVLECYRQGGSGWFYFTWTHIRWIHWKKYHLKIPGLMYSCSGIVDDKIFDKVRLAGGLYSGIVLCLLGMFSMEYSGGLEFSLMTVGVVNILYGVYEKRYLRDYPRGRFVLYGIVIAGMSYLYYGV